MAQSSSHGRDTRTTSSVDGQHNGATSPQIVSEKDPATLEIGDLSAVKEQQCIVQFSDEPPTGKWELWSWWGFYFANNSAGTLSYAPLIFQSVLNQAGFNGNDPSQDCGDDLAPCVVKFGVSNVNINTVVLVCNGLIFAFNGILLLVLGPMGDYGRWKRWILLICTLVCWATQFAFLGLKDGQQYKSAIAIYILSTVSYNICQAFWQPSLPLLARNTRVSIEALRAFGENRISEDEYQTQLTLQRNKLSNIAFGAMSTGYTVVLVIALGAAFALDANSSKAANTRAAVIIVGIATGFWILFGSPWFFLEKKRSQPLPPGETYLSVGVKAYWQLIRHSNRLGQTWLYLVGYFFLSDGHATAIQVAGICQNSVINYNTIISTELSIVQGIANLVGILLFWIVQRYWRFPTKPMLLVVASLNLLIPIWGGGTNVIGMLGSIGIGTTKFGMHNVWEFWAYSVFNCAFVAPFYAYSASMLSDIVPKRREVTFFALWALFGKATAWVGPIISGVIIDRTGNTWKGFPFALGLSIVGLVLIAMVDVPKARRQSEEWAQVDSTLHKSE